MQNSISNQWEVLKFNISDNLELLIVELDDREMTINISIENTCNAMLESGLIDDFDEDVIMIDTYISDEESVGERLVVKHLDIIDFINDLSLEDCKRIVEAFFKNNCYNIHLS